jgi:hypothetical protein
MRQHVTFGFKDKSRCIHGGWPLATCPRGGGWPRLDGSGVAVRGVHIFMAKVDSAHEIRESCSRTRPGGGGEGVLLTVDFVGGEGDEGVHATEIVDRLEKAVEWGPIGSYRDRSKGVGPNGRKSRPVGVEFSPARILSLFFFFYFQIQITISNLF